MVEKILINSMIDIEVLSYVYFLSQKYARDFLYIRFKRNEKDAFRVRKGGPRCQRKRMNRR